MRLLRAIATALVAASPAVRPAAAQIGVNLIDAGAWSPTSGTSAHMCLEPGSTALCFLNMPGAFVPAPDPHAPDIAYPAPADTVSQTIATVTGASYRLRFVGRNVGMHFGSSVLDVLWGGTAVFHAVVDDASGTGGPFELILRAQRPSTVLAFSSALAGACQGGTCDDWMALMRVEEISVHRVMHALTVPEPAALPMVGSGLLLVCGAVRRRRA